MKATTINTKDILQKWDDLPSLKEFDLSNLSPEERSEIRTKLEKLENVAQELKAKLSQK